MKTIEEIMGLVARFGEYAQIAARKDLHGSMDEWMSADEKQCEKFKEIESALRELVERKPLSDEEVFNIYCNSDSTLNTTSVNLALFARAIERTHGIGA